MYLEACAGTALAEQNLDAIGTYAARNLSFSLNEDDPASFFGGCDFACGEAIVKTCSGHTLSWAAAGLCAGRAVTHPFSGAGLGFSEAAIEAAYARARSAGFA